jgi:transcriptional regulator with XRE-family HTH domain
MEKDNRRAKVTPETKEESRRLAELWATRPHPSQAEFGETYGIGNQSAVGQFLRGDVPLSLKAARGFALGLGVTIEQFSPRLAAEAASLAGVIPAADISAEFANLVAQAEKLSPKQRAFVLELFRGAVIQAPELLPEEEDVGNSAPSQRMKAA